MTEQHLPSAMDTSAAPVLCMMAVALTLLLITTVAFRIMHPGMTDPRPMPGNQQQTSMPAAQQDQLMAHIGELMQKVKDNPQDTTVMLELVNHFIEMQQWVPAEQFARRVTSLAPQIPTGHYMLSVALHGLERNEEAAASLEQAVALDDSPTLRYSLGVLYAHYLNNKTKAAEHFRAGLAKADAMPQLRKDLESELAKVQ